MCMVLSLLGLRLKGLHMRSPKVWVSTMLVQFAGMIILSFLPSTPLHKAAFKGNYFLNISHCVHLSPPNRHRCAQMFFGQLSLWAHARRLHSKRRWLFSLTQVFSSSRSSWTTWKSKLLEKSFNLFYFGLWAFVMALVFWKGRPIKGACVSILRVFVWTGVQNDYGSN